MIKVAIILLLLLGGLALRPPTVSGSEDLEDFEWLIGSWTRSRTHGMVHETWRRLSDSVFEGGSYLINSHTGERQQEEWILLANMDGRLCYIVKPKGNPAPVVFNLVAASANSFKVENLNHDFPQRIIYKRKSDSAMTVTIEGPGENSETRRIDFSFKRLE